MNTTLGAVSALLLLVPCGAQVSLSVTAVTPVAVTAQAAAGTFNNSLPAGPLGSLESVQVGAPSSPGTGPFARYVHQASFDQASAACEFRHSLRAPGASSASVVHELLLELHAPAAVPVVPEFDYTYSAPPGAAMPLVSVDVGDDGNDQFVNGAATGSTGPWIAGPQPLQIRVRFAAGLAGQSEAELLFRVRLVPATATFVQQAAVGCGNSNLFSTGHVVQPSFVGTGIECYTLAWPGIPAVFCFGTDMAPAVLPNPLAPQACLLLPRVDATALVVYQQGPVHVDLPAALRPLTLWTQSVQLRLSDASLWTSDAFQVLAL